MDVLNASASGRLYDELRTLMPHSIYGRDWAIFLEPQHLELTLPGDENGDVRMIELPLDTPASEIAGYILLACG